MGTGKAGIWVAGALVTGFVAGAALTRASYHRLERELAAAQEELADLKAKRGERLAGPMSAGLRALLERPIGVSTVDRDAGGDERESAAAAEPPAPVVDATPAPASRGPIDDRTMPIDERIDMAIDTWRVRSAQARAAMLEAVSLDPDQQEAFEGLVDDMNAEVQRVVADAVDAWSDARRIQPRDLVDLMVELGTVYQDVDDRWRQIVTDDQYDRALDTGFDLFSQVDPEDFVPLVQQLDNE